MSTQADLDFAVSLAKSAARVVLDHYGKVARLTKTHAAAHDEAVTDADRAAQRHILSAIRERYPTDGIVGEESDSGESITAVIPDADGRVWVIDPIDGTNNFVGRFGNFAVCIGLLEAGMPTLGVVLDVTRDWTYAAAKGLGCTLNGQPVSATPTPIGDASILMLTSNLKLQGRLPNWVPVLMAQNTWKIRIIGSAALEAAQVAAGIAHAAITCNGKLWDVAAPAALVLESGGSVTTLDGAHDIFPFDLRDYTGAKVPFLAAAPQARAAVTDVIRKNP